MDTAELSDAYHRWWVEELAGPWRTTWRGVPTVKNPLDLFVFAELFWRVRPDWIIETGTWQGGSAAFYGDLCSLAGCGHVVTIDRRPPAVDHPHVTFLQGDSLTVALPDMPGCRMVVLDSDHSTEHVHAELERFGPLVTPGSYLIVEDTNVAGHPVAAKWLPGDPAAAVTEWLTGHPEFIPDTDCERYGLTMNPGGWLHRVR